MEIQQADISLTEGRSPLPLYHRLYAILRERIANGTYAQGRILPSEGELMASFGVSRITARRALNELASEGLVERSRGRGTTVTAAAAALRVGSPISASIDGLLANLSVIGHGTTVELHTFDYVAATSEVASQLQITPRTVVQCASRVRRLNGQPFSHSTSYVLESVARTYTADELLQAPLIDLIHRAGITIGEVQQAITCTLADDVNARLLEVSAGSPLLKLRRVFIDIHETPIDYSEILYTPERFEYRMVWSRDGEHPLHIDTAAGR